jgi:hypothetical protein
MDERKLRKQRRELIESRINNFRNLTIDGVSAISAEDDHNLEHCDAGVYRGYSLIPRLDK